jgi:hypothetical protein
MRLRRRTSGGSRTAVVRPERKRREPRRSRPEGVAKTAVAAVVDLVGIAREMLAWPVRLWLRAAEVVGEVVFTAWRSIVVPLLLLALRILRAALRIGEREVTPARGLAVVALAATISLGASQFADYQAVQVGAPEYRSVENVAPAPEVDSKTPRSAHGIAVFAIAVASLFVTAFAVARSWRLARMLIPLGAAAVLISLLADVHQGLSEGNAGIAYQGANAVLLGGFWAQLFSAATLMIVGPLLAAQLRGRREGRRARRAPGSWRRRGTARLARAGGGSGVEGAAP